ncbi:MAG: Fe-S cluster assembly protein SufB [Candidatus Aenigmarchaeota archaeon]|nr:Fe-S cluster assembly protein SufB [Candidatus Aenigmarchaeota archaeon]
MTNQELAEMKTDYKYGFHVDEEYIFKAKKGLSEEIVREISAIKKEPQWMLDFRLKSLKAFWEKPMPKWGANLRTIDFQDIYYYLKPTEGQVKDWSQLPEGIKSTFDRLGIPEAERNFLAGAGAQFDSETVYHKIREDLEQIGVIFTDMDTALREHSDIVKKHFGTVIPHNDNKFAALNSAVWSGGSFVYVPAGVKVELPLQAYFRINAQNMGQFERTLIIVEPGSFVHYVEGCTAPVYATDSLHAAVVEVIANENSRVRYTTIQNWSNNVYNLVTKRAFAYRNATVEWIDGNLGSKITMKYPAVYLLEEGAKADILSIAFAGKGQHQDAGAKAVHMAPNTTSTIISKSISKGGGRTTYRGLLSVAENADNSKSHVKCDALILDDQSASDTVPYMEINNKNVNIGHEATTGKVSEDQVFYLMSRGLSEQQAMTMIVSGFIEPFVKELPLEYAIELNRLIQMEMEGSVG